MSTDPGSQAQDVGENKQEALRALLNSLAPGGQMSLPNDADMRKLAEKLDELLVSKGGLLGAQDGMVRDDEGRPLNEEGLPIMEIVEPVTNDSPADPPPPPSVSAQATLSPLPNWALSPTALAARRRERDRILDMLEREEQDELAREVASSSSSMDTTTQAPTPRMLDQIARPWTDTPGPSPMLTAPTNVSVPPGPKSKSGPSKDLDIGVLDMTTAHKPKKQRSVSFADPFPSDHSKTDPDVDWGDVVPVPFNSRAARTPRLGVMKELVVERLAGASSSRVEDSDDEEEVTEGEDENVSQDDGSETEVPPESLHPLEKSDESEDDPVADVDETDFDEAMLQREIALAYYARRNQIGSGVTSGPLSDSTVINHMDAEPDVDEQLNSSRFRRSRLDGDPQTLINSAIQFGKLVDGQLVAAQVADKEVEESLDKLTRGGGEGKDDKTEETIALLMHGRDQSTGSIIQSNPPKQNSSSLLRGNISQSKAVVDPKSKPQPMPLTSFTSSQQLPNSASFAAPMIIESGFGFDPTLKAALPTASAAAKYVPPVSETVLERSSPPSMAEASRGKGKSRLAQASRTAGVKPSLLPALNPETLKPKAMRGDAVERVASNNQPPEPKRMSRFRAERAGYL